jgi:hypothetical protein
MMTTIKARKEPDQPLGKCIFGIGVYISNWKLLPAKIVQILDSWHKSSCFRKNIKKTKKETKETGIFLMGLKPSQGFFLYSWGGYWVKPVNIFRLFPIRAHLLLWCVRQYKPEKVQQKSICPNTCRYLLA